MTFNKLTCLLGDLVRHNPVSPMKTFHPFYWEQSWCCSLKLTELLCGINECSVLGKKQNKTNSRMFCENTPSNTGHCCDTPCLLILPPPLSPSVGSQIVGPIWKPKEDASQGHSLCPAPYLSEVKIQTRIWLKDCSQTQNTVGKIRGGRQDLKVVRHCVSFCVHFVYIICFGRFETLCILLCTLCLHNLLWEIWFLISHPQI